METELRQKCELLDLAKDGTITTEELRKAISSLGEDIGSNDLAEMIQEAGAGVGEERVKYLVLIRAMYAEDEQADS